jgi:hypothetical protein
VLEDDLGPVVLLEDAAAHHRHLVRHSDGFELVVRHVDHGGLKILVEALELGSHLHPQFGVEV